MIADDRERSDGGRSLIEDVHGGRDVDRGGRENVHGDREDVHGGRDLDRHDDGEDLPDASARPSQREP